jgi:3'-phosphoadenosine 5'-phosphosulfate sulfotransferase (PAPS reductase)/FAD synthetase
MSAKKKETKKDNELKRFFNREGLQVNLDFEKELKAIEENTKIEAVSDPRELTFEQKVARSKALIIEAVEQFGIDQVYTAFSGGKDSAVVAHLVESIYPKMVPEVFCNTGLELPEIVKMVKKHRDHYKRNVVILRPVKSFRQVISEYGYPIISKQVAMAISRWQNTSDPLQRILRWRGGINRKGKMQKTGVIPNKFKHLALMGESKIKDSEDFMTDELREKVNGAPNFKVTERCCYFFKKAPFVKYEKDQKKKLGLKKSDKFLAFTGTRSDESFLRKQDFLKYGCNAFNKGKPRSRPIMFWDDEDVNRYIKEYNVEICEVYYDQHRFCEETQKIIFVPAEERTGCMFCAYGLHMDVKKDPKNTRFHRLKLRHPKLYKYCMEKLGFRKVLKEYVGIDFD